MDGSDAKAVVFLGPSYPATAAAEIVESDFRPPVRRGDIFRLLATDVAVIVLIDGVFHSDPSVGHREILAAVDEGITVIGASSMGALRAAELHDLGVEGYGTIFQWYRDGYIDGDDEVALHHETAERGYHALSEPLVNIRATLHAAVRAGRISAGQADAVVQEARATFYPERSFDRLIKGPAASRWPSSIRDSLARFVRVSYVDLKAQDARGALVRAREAMQERDRRMRSSAPPSLRRCSPDTVDFGRFSTRLFVDRHGREFRFLDFTTAIKKSDCMQEMLLPLLSARWFTLRWARDRAIDFPRDEMEPIERRIRSTHATNERDFLRRNSLTAGEYAGWVDRQARFEWLIQKGPQHFGVAWGTERQVALDQKLFPLETVGVRAVRGFLVEWGHTQGLSAPASERAALRARWEADGDPASGDASLVSDLALARWLTITPPVTIGFRAETLANAVLELQASDRVADVLRP